MSYQQKRVDNFIVAARMTLGRHVDWFWVAIMSGSFINTPDKVQTLVQWWRSMPPWEQANALHELRGDLEEAARRTIDVYWHLARELDPEFQSEPPAGAEEHPHCPECLAPYALNGKPSCLHRPLKPISIPIRHDTIPDKPLEIPPLAS